MNRAFRHLSGRFRSVIERAEAEARALNHAYIGTEHLLLALLQDPSGSTASVLQTFGRTTDEVRREIEKLISRGPSEPPAGKLPLTPRAQLAIEFAGQEVAFVNCDDCDDGIVLVGLAREPDGVAAQVFCNLGLSLPMVAEEVFKFRILQMKIVERTVRPIRASTPRKRKIREELLAHLTEIYDQELSRMSDPAAATNEAARRFGDPAELSRELEKSLPHSERRRYCYERWFGWRAPETAVKWLSRLGLQLFLFLVTLCTIGIVADIIIAGLGIFQWKDLRGALAFVITLPLAVSYQGILVYKMRDAMFGVFGARKSLTRVLMLQTLIVMYIVGGSMAYVAFAEWSLTTAASALVPVTVAGILLAVTVRFAVRFTGPTEIRDTYWACLDLNSVCD